MTALVERTQTPDEWLLEQFDTGHAKRRAGIHQAAAKMFTIKHDLMAGEPSRSDSASWPSPHLGDALDDPAPPRVAGF